MGFSFHSLSHRLLFFPFGLFDILEDTNSAAFRTVYSLLGTALSTLCEARFVFTSCHKPEILEITHTKLGHLTTSNCTSILCRCGHKITFLEELSFIKLLAAIYCESVREDSLVSIASRNLTRLKEIRSILVYTE